MRTQTLAMAIHGYYILWCTAVGTMCGRPARSHARKIVLYLLFNVVVVVNIIMFCRRNRTTAQSGEIRFALIVATCAAYARSRTADDTRPVHNSQTSLLKTGRRVTNQTHVARTLRISYLFIRLPHRHARFVRRIHTRVTVFYNKRARR